MRVLLGGKQERVVKQEFEEVSIPPHLMTGGSDVSFLFFNLSCLVLDDLCVTRFFCVLLMDSGVVQFYS